MPWSYTKVHGGIKKAGMGCQTKAVSVCPYTFGCPICLYVPICLHAPPVCLYAPIYLSSPRHRYALMLPCTSVCFEGVFAYDMGMNRGLGGSRDLGAV